MRLSLTQHLFIAAPPEKVWVKVIDVDIHALPHPPLFQLLGIPQPLKAEVHKREVGGTRTAHFAGGHCFSQVSTEWRPGRRYAFTFQASPGFRVAYFFDLSPGPFQMRRGAYDLKAVPGGARLSLSSQYELHGSLVPILLVPVHLVMVAFQRFLLRGIRKNAESEA